MEAALAIAIAIAVARPLHGGPDPYQCDQEQIAALYVSGFVSAMIFGPLLGAFADKLGRKHMGLVFCGLYSLCCVLKLSSS